jgi:hypothetical protein
MPYGSDSGKATPCPDGGRKKTLWGSRGGGVVWMPVTELGMRVVGARAKVWRSEEAYDTSPTYL